MLNSEYGLEAEPTGFVNEINKGCKAGKPKTTPKLWPTCSN